MEIDLLEGARDFIGRHKNLTMIYEHFIEDDFKIDKALSAIAKFRFEDIDGVNRAAVKLG